MHSAPAVSYPVGRSHFQAVVFSLAWLVGLLAGTFWLLEDRAWDWRHALFATLLVLGAGLAARSWQKTSSGTLRWDGQTWWLSADHDPHAGRVNVHLDLQQAMLLSLTTEGGAVHWFWLQRSVSPLTWQAFRRAVHARQADSQEPSPERDALTGRQS